MKKLLLTLLLATISTMAKGDEVVYLDGDLTQICPEFLNWIYDGDAKLIDGVRCTDGSGTLLPGLGTPKHKDMAGFEDSDATSPRSLLEKAGWTVNGNMSFQRSRTNCYYKMSTGSGQGILMTPAIATFGDGKETATISFDYCGFKNTDKNGGIYDDTEIVVVVVNGDDQKQFPVEKKTYVDKTAYAWSPISITITGATLNKDTKIAIRNADSQYYTDPENKTGEATVKGNHRYFIRNLKVSDGETIYLDGDLTKICPEFLNWMYPTNAIVKGLNGVGCTDGTGSKLPGLGTPKHKDMAGFEDSDATSPKSLLEKAGWTVNGNMSFQRSKTNCYYKMSTGSGQGILMTPAIATFGDGKETATVSFDYCGFKNTDKNGGIYDDTEIVVVVVNGDDQKQFPVEKKTYVDKTAYAWSPISINLTGVTLNKDTRIAIRNADSQYYTDPNNKTGEAAVKGNHRYFIRNLKVVGNTETSVSQIAVDENAPVEYYNLQGVKIENPSKGLYIKVRGSKAEKVMIR